MFNVDRILAIPDLEPDHVQCGISGGERAALAARGFVRKDGTKAKDYMIRTIQETEKNKAKAEKAIIKGDKPLSNTNGTFLSSNPRNAKRQDSMRKDMEVLKNTQFKYDQGQKATVVTGSGDRTRKEEVGILDSYVQDGQVRYTVYPKGKKSSVGSHFWVKESDLTPVASTKKQSKSKPENTPIATAPTTTKKLAVTYNKQGDLSEGSAAKKIKGAIANQRSKKPVETTPKKSNKQKSDQASRLVEKTRKAYDQAVDKVSRLSDELSELRSQAQDGKSKVATGRTKKRASEMTNAMKFNAALEAEAMNNGEAIPVMRKKANKNQMASLNDRINQKEIEQADALSRVNQLKTRANKLYNASVDYANKPDTATTSATPKSRKVVKGTSPRRFKKLPDDKIQNGLGVKQENVYQSALLDGKINRSAYDKLVGNNYSDVVTIKGRKVKAQQHGDYAVHQRYAGAVDSKGEEIGSSRESLLTHAPTGKWIISSEMLGAKSTPKAVKKKRLELIAKEVQKIVPDLAKEMTSSQRSALQDLVNKAKKGEYDKPKQPSATAKKLNMTAEQEARALKNARRS